MNSTQLESLLMEGYTVEMSAKQTTSKPKESKKMQKSVERPAFVEREHLVYLDELRESGKTNMFGARPYLLMEFPELSEKEAGSVLVYWMDTFGERHG